MDHVNSIRAPSLKPRTYYVMRVWTKQPTYQQVKFIMTCRGTEVLDKSPKLNIMKPGDAMYFIDANGAYFAASAKDQVLVNTDGVRLTFFNMEPSAPAVVDSAPVDVVQSTEELTVVEDKLSKRNRLKRESRAAAKLETSKQIAA